jgi:hypothetical protein
MTAASAARSLLMESLESRILLTADDQISEAIPIAIGASVSGSISPATDVDMYRVAVSAGQNVAFDIDTTNNVLDSYIRLFNSAGTQLAFDDDSPAPGESTPRDSYLEHTFASAGNYYLGVSGYGNQIYNPVTGGGDNNGSQGSYTLRVSSNAAPTIGSLSDSPDPVTAPATVTLTANSVVDSDGTVANVQFYRETDGAAGLQVGSDLLLATDSTAAPYSTTIDTSMLPGGVYTYYARAIDNLGRVSNVASAANTVQVINDASITGTVWNDADGDAVRDVGESVLTGWTVFLDANRNRVRDSGEGSTTTNSNGIYTFAGLAGAQTYYVTTQVPAGWQQTYPGAGGQVSAMTTAEATASAAVVAKPVPAVTTTGSTVPVELIESTVASQLSPATGNLVTADLESNPLIRLTEFHSDPRFNTIRGQNHAVAVLDTGIDLNHAFFGPDSDGNGVADRIVYQYDFADNDTNASDSNGHGTNVASIVGSQGSSAPGMAPNVNIIALKVFPDAGGGNFSYVEKALQWVVNNAAAYNIASINMSLGDSANYNVATTQSVIGINDELAALAAMNVIVVSAAGNSFFTHGSAQGVSYPAADPNSLAVSAVWDSSAGGQINWSDGAIDYSSAADRVASFTQRSTALTDIFAPGPWSTGGNQTGGTNVQGGTSQAAPHIAGIAALAQQLAMRELGRRLTMSEFKSLLYSSGVSIFDGDDENDNVTNTNAGFRRVDVMALGEAIAAMGSTPYTHTVRLGHRQAATGIDFGERAFGSISGTVFDDYDGDNVRDAAEPGRSGVTLYIDANGNDALDAGEPSLVSGAGGTYTFGSLGPGSYSVRQIVPNGYIATIAEHAVALAADQSLVNLDFTEFRVTHAGTAANDAYLIRRDAGGTRIEVVSGSITWSQAAATIDTLAPGGIDFNLGGGDDTLTIDHAFGPALPAGGSEFIGGASASVTGDRLILIGAASDETFNASATGVGRAGDIGQTSYSGIEGLTINAGDGNDTVNINGAPSSPVMFNGGLNAAYTDTLNVNAGAFTFNADANAGTANLQLNVNGATSAVTFNATQHLAGLSLTSGGIATMPANGNRYLFTRGLNIAANARLDLADNDLIWDYDGDSPFLTARGYVVTGRAGVSGITSSTTTGETVLAIVDNVVYGKTSWNDELIDQTTLISKYTYYGDSNLDGTVTGDDYVAIDSNLGKIDAQWIHGDFNFDGRTSGDDYVSVDANLGLGTLDPAAYDAEQAEMIALHADRYGGKTYIQQVEEAAGDTRKTKSHRPAARVRAKSG